MIDYNKLQSFGRVDEVLQLEPLKQKFEAFNLDCLQIDGHAHDAIYNALNSSSSNPRVIILDTQKAHPLKYAVNKLESHYYPPTAEQLIDGLNNINEHYERYICK